MPVLTADASGTVTINGDLRVYTKKPESATAPATGLIVQIEKPAAPGDLPGKPAGLGLVSSVDLGIKKLTVNRSANGARLTLAEGFFFNTGDAPITDVQFHATVYATNFTTGVDQETTPLVRGLTIGPKGQAELIDRNEPEPDNRLTFLVEQTALHNPPITLVLTASGYGPGFTPVFFRRKIESLTQSESRRE